MERRISCVRGARLGRSHDYGDVCQSVTDVAVELNAPNQHRRLSQLNRCLDDAIAGAVTEYARADDATRQGTSHELRNLTDAAITAFEVLQAGHRSLLGIRALVDRQRADVAEPDK